MSALKLKSLRTCDLVECVVDLTVDINTILKRLEQAIYCSDDNIRSEIGQIIRDYEQAAKSCGATRCKSPE